MLIRHNSTVPAPIEGITSPTQAPKQPRDQRQLKEITQLQSQIKKLQQQLAEVLCMEDDLTIKE
jgi:hypothetical protein